MDGKIYFIRHTQSEANKRAFAIRDNKLAPLTEFGQEQARNSAAFYRDWSGFDFVQ